MKTPALVITLTAICLSASLTAKPLPPHPPGAAANASTSSLQQYMATFGTMLAGLEILKVHEKQVDWDVVDLSLREMAQTLGAMQRADSQNRYREYTDILAAGLVDLRAKGAKRDKNFFKALDQVSESCFKCHAAHRPGDYLVPEEKHYSGD